MPSAKPTLELYDFMLSGHCHRVRLLLSSLKLPYRAIGMAKSKPPLAA
jgi:hypothetical protein